MHPIVSASADDAFYGGELVDAPSTNKSLESTVPDLPAAIDQVLAQFEVTIPAEEKTQRVHYFVVNGVRRQNSQTKSNVVIEHPYFFAKYLWPHLHKVFGDKFENEVYIIVAYKEAKKWWLTVIQAMMSKHQLPRSHFPTVMTIDVAQGHEATMTVSDYSTQAVEKKTDVGFIADYGQYNVGSTRARAVQWVLGGKCEGPYLTSAQKKGPGAVPIPVQYFNSCTANNQQTFTGFGPIDEDRLPWM